MESKLPKTNCNIPMPSYVKTNDKELGCEMCIHEDVCTFSKEYKNFCNEIDNMREVEEYKHFNAKPRCDFYKTEQVMMR